MMKMKSFIGMFDVTDATRIIDVGGYELNRRLVHWGSVFPPAPCRRRAVDRRGSLRMPMLLTAAAVLVALAAPSSQTRSQPTGVAAAAEAAWVAWGVAGPPQ